MQWPTCASWSGNHRPTLGFTSDGSGRASDAGLEWFATRGTLVITQVGGKTVFFFLFKMKEEIMKAVERKIERDSERLLI